MTYFCHHKDDYDKMTDEEKVLSMKQYWDKDYSHMKKMRGIDNGYQTEDGNFYIKVITKNKDWFSRYFN
jgi:hypothetical protein